MVSDYRRDKTKSEAWAICDRTGTRFPMKDMVVEPGTGYLVHKKVCDGEWNAVDHPQGNLMKYLKFGDPFPVTDARPNSDTAVSDAQLAMYPLPTD